MQLANSVERCENFIVCTWTQQQRKPYQKYEIFICFRYLSIAVQNRKNYWGSSMWISTQQVNYRSYILLLSNTWEKTGNILKQFISSLYSILQESLWFSQEGGLYNILIESGIPMKLARLTKMCLTETYSRVRVGKKLSDMFPIRNVLK